jgi:hypothetical protein
VRTGSLNQVREAHTATVRSNGQLLAANGEVKNSSGGFTILASAELYTPQGGRMRGFNGGLPGALFQASRVSGPRA